VLRNLDLFSGIMGFTLGLERTGCYQTVGFCEIEPYCQAFIREKRPDTPLWQDIERLNDWLEKALTLYQAVFPARTYLWQEKTLGYSTTEPPAKPKPVQDSGGNWLEPFAWYDREKRIWRTFRQYLEGEWEPYSETWPKSGMTRNGIAYRRQLSERRTSENASGVLPTPQAHDYKSGKGFNSQGRGHSRQLRHLVNGTLWSVRKSTPRIWTV
jgi:hypothetical protein